MVDAWLLLKARWIPTNPPPEAMPSPWRLAKRSCNHSQRAAHLKQRTAYPKGFGVIGALLLGLVAGFIGRAIVPNDVFENLSGPTSWLASIVLGLVGAAVGWLIFTAALGIGDTDVFDWGGILSALIGVVIVLLVAGFVMRRAGGRQGPATT
jgi:uncharacterized membrane protein YeaQ/YmgE (transglycosylase-associated protein family)